MKLKVSNVCQLLDKSKYLATTTYAGVTFTNNGDGTITANGTTNEVYVQYNIQIPQFKEVKNDHKYVLFSGINDINVDFVECIFWLGRQDSSYFATNCAETNIAGTFGFTIPQGEYSLYQQVALRVRRGYTANNLTFKPQLFDLTEMYGAGHEPTTVAQFRQDFPNDLYPYAPKCWLTSYKHNLIATTKNLLSYSETTAEFPESEWENTHPRDLSEGVWYVATSANNYSIKGTVTDYKIERNLLYINVAQAAYGLSRAFKCNPGEVYTLSVRGNGNIQLGVGFFDMSGNYLSYINRDANLLLFTTPTNCKWFWVNFAASQNNSKIYFRDIQLEEGSTATPYQPYGYLPLRRGKFRTETRNLLQLNDFSNSWLTIKGNAIRIKKTNDVQVYDDQVGFSPISSQLKAGKYYRISAKVIGEFTGRLYRMFGDSLYRNEITDGRWQKTFTTDTVTDKYGLYIAQNNTTSIGMTLISDEVVIYDIMLEESDTAFTGTAQYQPYKHVSFH